ncbi:MAG: Hpt domain-containing protein [Betaproteobacteria bacterium]|nr:Hpt domain-containing protein [Betaproteobacteria bacterium]
MEFIGDMDGVHTLLATLQSSLEQDLPEIQARLDAGNVPGANELLHQLKGFAPVFCVDDLVAQVVAVESVSKHPEIAPVREAYAQLAPRLQQLLAEVRARRSAAA